MIGYSIINDIDYNKQRQIKGMDNSSSCKFVQIWKCYPLISAYLSQKDRINMSATNSVIRQLTSNFTFWPTLQMTGNFDDNNMFVLHLKWISKYMRKYKPTSLHISIHDIGNNSQILISIFMEGIVESVEKLDIYCQDQQVHLACSLCFCNLQQLTIRSKCVNNQLVEFMTQNMAKLNSLIVIKNDLQFTCKKLSKYMPNPMQKLIMKPYAIDFEQVQKMTELSAMAMQQLQLDVQECPQNRIIKIVQPLRKLQKLRLYHLQNLDDDTLLWQVMKNQSKVRQLALTKAYNLQLNRILVSITSCNLVSLDITDSKYVNDQDIRLLSEGCPNLKQVNVSWCNSISSQGLQLLISNCFRLQVLNLTGIKDAKDVIFGPYNKLLAVFNQEVYNKAKNMAMNNQQLKHDDKFYNFDRFFAGHISNIQITTLRNLKLLDCQSCNGISDNILKIIYLINPKARTYNYYGNYMGLFPNDNQSTFC